MCTGRPSSNQPHSEQQPIFTAAELEELRRLRNLQQQYVQLLQRRTELVLHRELLRNLQNQANQTENAGEQRGLQKERERDQN
ncbi:hypothetical protein L596_006278 [Steinernema carpocapsae]|uniref:Uncharacterized protein n=1 Tax=Steinernema carpocapsae TaxID=34508 RepID=A0A4U8V380_STECR|nr:hypothetical protein L596_006278 [Steinernema carpocapsae]